MQPRFCSTVVLLLAAALPAAAAPAVPRTMDEQAALAAVEATLAAVSARDEPGIRRYLRPTGTATVLFHRADGSVSVRSSALDAYAEATPGPERYAERMHDPLVRVQGAMALVWGRYSFAVDGKVAHCGEQHFDLVREDGQWKIQNVTWSVQMSGCGAAGTGPE
ncbi:nuclear transport factor 2 family protein [Rhodanobacter umsongensis]|uniref:Nuclear transport factor 2 family protein n=1 Tax=Rhodanobacter umsongensis TaxID=633153 RepID=A0ABW0JN06_9GAMM